MLADSPYRHELEADIDPFRSILLGLFFLSIGMMLDLDVIAQNPGFVVGMAAALIAVKTAVLFAIARAAKVESRDALQLGLLLSQGGEFAFVLFAAAQGAALIESSAASLFGAVVTLSMATTPFLMMLNDWLDRKRAVDRSAGLDGPAESPPTRAIVVGYGRFGQTVAQIMMAKGVDVTLIDSKPSQIEISGDFGAKVYYGDGTRIDLLRLAGAGEAEALFFCHSDKAPMPAHRLEAILESFPQAGVFVRAFDRRHVMELAQLDLADLVREVFESAVLMGQRALLHFGVEQADAEQVIAEYRERDRIRLESQSASGDLHAGKESMFGPDNPIGAQPSSAARNFSTSSSPTE
jgi:glutathione-regulated potassium-efflux system protein KefB